MTKLGHGVEVRAHYHMSSITYGLDSSVFNKLLLVPALIKINRVIPGPAHVHVGLAVNHHSLIRLIFILRSGSSFIIHFCDTEFIYLFIVSHSKIYTFHRVKYQILRTKN